MTDNQLLNRLMATCQGRQRRSQAERTVAFLCFVADEMRDKGELRDHYARNTIAAYRRHLRDAGLAPIRTFEDLDWLAGQVSREINRVSAAVRLLWVLNASHRHTQAHAESLLGDLIADYADRLGAANTAADNAERTRREEAA